MEKHTAQIFKASGKWYMTFEFDLEVSSPHLSHIYDQIGHAIRETNSNWNYCQPNERTLDSWFAIVVVDELPMVIWFH